jgi:hypothetical protein
VSSGSLLFIEPREILELSEEDRGGAGKWRCQLVLAQIWAMVAAIAIGVIRDDIPWIAKYDFG